MHVYESIDALAGVLGASTASVISLIESASAKLLTARNLRVWPARDEKVLVSWNALMIKGLAVAARVLRRPDLADAAAAAVDFIHRTLWRDGRLLATYKDGRAHLPAYLDDYAFLADALLELLQTRWRSSDLEFARTLTDALLVQFEAGARNRLTVQHRVLELVKVVMRVRGRRPRGRIDRALDAGEHPIAAFCQKYHPISGVTRQIRGEMPELPGHVLVNKQYLQDVASPAERRETSGDCSQ